MGVGVGVGEALAVSKNERASDPFGTKDGRDLDPAVIQELTGSAQRLNSLGLPLLNQTNRAVSGELANLPGLSTPITMESLTSNPSFGAIKSAIESQFNNARNSTIATGGEGGALQGTLGNLEGQRAASLSQGLGQLAVSEDQRRQNVFNSVVGAGGQLGLGEVGQAGRNLGALGGAQAAIAQANIAGDASNKNAKIGAQSEQGQSAAEVGGTMMGGK